MKNKKVRKTRPFEGKINQLKRETVVLCNLAEFDKFKEALSNAHVDYDLGDFFGDNDIIIVKK
jgi:hypothetical protein